MTSDTTKSSQGTQPRSGAAAAGRIQAVDVLRGFDMFWIIGGAGLVRALEGMEPNAVTRFFKQQLTHVQWEGLRFYDLIFPLFLFLVGVSIVFSMEKAVMSASTATLVKRVLRRGLLLFALGFIYHGGLTRPWPEVRLSGVLQLIAVCYVLAALIYLWLRERLRALALLAVGLLGGTWAVLTFVPFPDFTLERTVVAELASRAGSDSAGAVTAQVPARVRGVYEEGRNVSNHLDYRFLPGRKVNVYYESQGLLSPLSAVTICLAGIFAGRLLRSGRVGVREKTILLIVGGLVAVGVGIGWSVYFPLVKKLWTSSFCLVTAGWSAVLLGGFYLVIDGWKFDRWCAPFRWLGMNAVTIYLGYELIRFGPMAERLVGGDVKAFFNERIATGSGALVQALVALGLALLLARFLFVRGIFLRV